MTPTGKIPYTKPFLTLDQQIALLASRGLAIPDTAFAKDCLKNIGYYRLSGYWYPMRESQLAQNQDGTDELMVTDTFRTGSGFAQIIDIYTYDKRLRILLMDLLERIEIAIRTDITLQLGQYSPWAYRDPQYFHPRFDSDILPNHSATQFAEFLNDFDTKTVPRSKAEFVKHFQEKYSDPLPIWAAVELWDFGTLATIFEGMKVQDKMAITKRYGLTKPDLLPSWIRSLAYLRNLCAHHSRVWNKPPVRQPKLPEQGKIPVLDHLHEDRYASQRLYAIIAVMRYLQQVIGPQSTWGEKLITLNDTFPVAPGIEFRHMGYPENWRELDLWRVV
jgi:abortive infection bacteriophage resistance protein